MRIAELKRNLCFKDTESVDVILYSPPSERDVRIAIKIRDSGQLPPYYATSWRIYAVVYTNHGKIDVYRTVIYRFE